MICTHDVESNQGRTLPPIINLMLSEATNPLSTKHMGLGVLCKGPVLSGIRGSNQKLPEYALFLMTLNQARLKQNTCHNREYHFCKAEYWDSEKTCIPLLSANLNCSQLKDTVYPLTQV
jgi:hypothetical protein